MNDGRREMSTNRNDAIQNRSRGRLRAFTLIELLTAIVVIGILITLIATVASAAMRQQRVSYTDRVMQNTLLAIEQFATEFPLKNIYGRNEIATFGPYPPYPYPSADWPPAGETVPAIVEPRHQLVPMGGQPFPPGAAALPTRLATDLSGRFPPNPVSDYVNFPNAGEGNDDILALMAYMQAYSPGVLRNIPEDRLKPLNPNGDPDVINPTGAGTDIGAQPGGIQDVLVVHDAWDVPLDYLLYVKLEWGLVPDQSFLSDVMPGYKVVDRRPALRSRGIRREIYDGIRRGDRPAGADDQNWIWSNPLPRPWANVDGGGGIQAPGANLAENNGWTRLVGANPDSDDPPGREDYGYLPSQD